MAEYRTMMIMFPKNHNTLIKVVIGEWDGTRGISCVELNRPNAYVEKQLRDIKTHKTKKSMIKRVEELVNEIQKENENLHFEESYESEETFFTSLFNKDKVDTILTPSVPIGIIEEDNKVLVTILAKTDLDIHDSDYAYIDVTNDPTLNIAGGVVSLGYYNWRIELKDVKVVNKNPIQLAAKKENVKRQHGRPCRRVL